MYYCFVIEDMKAAAEQNTLALQAAYAEKLGRVLFADIAGKRLLNRGGEPIRLGNDRVFLRSSVDYAAEAMELVTANGGELLESAGDVDAIEHWPERVGCGREILPIACGALLSRRFDGQTLALLNACEAVFIKTRSKGFSAAVSSARVLGGDREFQSLLTKHCRSDSELLLSERLQIKRDFLGKKEARFFVFDGRIANASRYLARGEHAVPLTLRRFAAETAERIAALQGFPDNYALDLALFCGDGRTWPDVVEINPVTCSDCYISNSIFPPEGSGGCGAEFLYDMRLHPERYAGRNGAADRVGVAPDNEYSLI